MLLAIDTATRCLSLALHDGTEVRAETTWQTANRHTVELAPAIQRLMLGAGLSMSALKALAVSAGPGSFNGLRVGMSIAKGMALALHVPLFAVPTLDIVAAAQPPFAGTLVAVAQAGRGRVCAERYHWSDGAWVAAGNTRIMSWDALVGTLDGPTLISGEIDEAGRDAIAHSGRPITVSQPAVALRRAGFLADLAWGRWRAGDPGNPEQAVPLYLHQPGVPHP
jgi:tRNA threonylcarbamoyladenosine biosynthesis protein TsaB